MFKSSKKQINLLKWRVKPVLSESMSGNTKKQESTTRIVCILTIELDMDINRIRCVQVKNW